MSIKAVKKLCFLIENTEVEIPEHFELFSGLVNNFITSYPKDSNGYIEGILLKNYQKKQLNVIFEFFYALKANPPSHRRFIPTIQSSNLENTLPLSLSQTELQEEETEENIDGAIVDADSVKPDIVKESSNCNNKMTLKEEVDDLKEDLSHLSSDIKVAYLPEWAENFFLKIQKDHLFEASSLANFLLAHPFIEHFSSYIADNIKSMESIKEMREFLNVEADFSPDEFSLLANDPVWKTFLVKENLI